MRVSPLDIRKQEFTRTFRGYEPEEVDAFLQMLSTEWEEMRDDHRRLEEQVRGLEEKIRHYERVEEALQEALQTARDSSRKAVENAEDRAQNIIRNAEAEAYRIQGDAVARRDLLRQENSRLLNRRHELVARLRAFLTSEMEMLERFESDQIVGEHSDEVHADQSELGPSVPGREAQPAPFPAGTPQSPEQTGEDQDEPEGMEDVKEVEEYEETTGFSDQQTHEPLRLLDREESNWGVHDQETEPQPDFRSTEREEDLDDHEAPMADDEELIKARQATEEIEKIRRILNDLD